MLMELHKLYLSFSQHVTKVVRSKLKPYYNSYLLFKTDVILGHNLPELLFQCYVLKPKKNMHFILMIFNLHEPTLLYPDMQ